jgi:hypothetical protein
MLVLAVGLAVATQRRLAAAEAAGIAGQPPP